MRERSTAEILADVLQQRGLSIRALARLLAGDGDDRETELWRRSLYRYLNGSDPEADKAEIMESRLGLPAETFPRFEHRRHSDDGTLGEQMAALVRRQEALAESALHTGRVVDELEGRVADIERELAARRARTKRPG